MTYFSTPEKVHEFLAVLIIVVMFPTALVAMGYIKALGAFFNELKEKEPEVWITVGAPGLLGMLLLPFKCFKKYYAFLPVLRARAARRDGEYKYAASAYMLLKAGLVMSLILFAVVGMTGFWIVFYRL